MLGDLAILRDIQVFGFGEQFYHDYYREFLVALYGESSVAEASSLAALMSADDRYNDIVSWVNSCIGRGLELRSEYEKFFDQQPAGGRLLDVGCGFGGSLIAFSNLMEAHGIELAPERLKAARALCRDHSIPGNLHSTDVMSPEFQDMGKFDTIMTENVVEHVDNPRSFIISLCRALTDTGRLMFEIPNFQSLEIVTRDPHYALPLISLLRHHEAKAFFESQLGARDRFGVTYQVGEYFKSAWYKALLQSENLNVAIVPKGKKQEDIDVYIDHINNIDISSMKCDTILKENIRLRVAEYVEDIRSQDQASDNFALNYQYSSWIVFAWR